MRHRIVCLVCLLLLCLTACGKHDDTPATAVSTTAPPLDADALLAEADVEHHDCAAQGHVFSQATCQSPARCYYCGETTGTKGAHDFTRATCLAKSVCTVCGLETGDFAAHLFTDATCAAPASCAVCGQTTGSAKAHDFRAATCVSPSRCAVCMQTRGSALGHQWTGGSCTEPKVCARCKRQLAAPGHKMTAGSCTEDAVCAVCGYTVKAAGHRFEDGVCVVCGQTKAEASRADASRAAKTETQTETTEPPIDTDALLQYGETIGQLLQSAHDTADDAIDAQPDERAQLLRGAVADLGSALDAVSQAQQLCRTDSRLQSLQAPLTEVQKAIRKSAAIVTIQDKDAIRTATTVRADATAGLQALQKYQKAVQAVKTD